MLVLGIFLRITSLPDRLVDKAAAVRNAIRGAVRIGMPFTSQLAKLDTSDLY
ncbi:hypothetical protein LJR029_002593 [Caballeronia sp. LjRoot29]|uniref:hypothetical protein n=1 Tax=Caballeronia sp. LjRoot29 TaxID=3342315 RepID=UPI003ED02DA7